MSTTKYQTPVLIVGAGPAGLAAAIMLARYGIGSLLVERRHDMSTLPRATGISTRTAEILRSWGLEDDVRAGGVDVEHRGWIARTLTSPEGTEVLYGLPTAEQAAVVSPSRPIWAPQDHLEPVLLAHLSSYPAAEIRFGTELVVLEQDDEAMTGLVRDRRSGEISAVRSQFVIGADGIRSAVRAELGIGFDGPDSLLEAQTVLFRAPLTRLIGDRRYGIYVITHPEASGIFLPVGQADRWLFGPDLSPGQEGLEDRSASRLTELIRTAAGDADLEPRIERISSFSFGAQLADRYREGRGFLVGDAAHRVTPRGGTGMNTAIHDAYDLGWKLAWVLHGWAAPELLDTYETDRRPVAVHNLKRSVDPDGSRRELHEELPHDLNGRVAHAWLLHEGVSVSTLDLLSPGLTLFAGPGGARWQLAAARTDSPMPLTAHMLDHHAARTVGIPETGAALLRPDGQEAVRWPTDTPDAEAVLETAIHRLVAPRQLVGADPT